jgi:hypothetical protein
MLQYPDMATPVQPLPGSILPTHISVTFTIVTPDQLRKIIFKLNKSSDSVDESWSISFELDERANPSQQFALVLQLQVNVDQNDHAKAAATLNKGLDTDQHAQALAAGDTAKDVETGDATKEDAQDDAKAIIAARNPASPS